MKIFNAEISHCFRRGALTVALLAASQATAQAGTILISNFNNDATSGISTTKIYTAKGDPGNDAAGAAVINGVTFDLGAVTGGTYIVPGATYANTGGVGTITQNGGNGFDVPAGAGATGVNSLLTDMVYTAGNAGLNNVTTLTMTGLTAGFSYSARIYYRQWDADGDSRTSTFAFDEDGAGPLGSGISVAEDAPPSGPADAVANILIYNYSAVAGQNLVINLTQGANNQSFHLYGFTNEVVPEPSRALLLLSGAGGLLMRRRRR